MWGDYGVSGVLAPYQGQHRVQVSQYNKNSDIKYGKKSILN
jgi:hypothetical protein